MQYGYLRETQQQALKEDVDRITRVCKTGLDEYLKVIFPEVTDWVHDKTTGIKELGRRRPDYRSESLKLIVEFDGLPHYLNFDTIIKDIESTKLYEKYGYKVIRIPYFIQLSNAVVEELFCVKVTEPLFDAYMPSLTSVNILPVSLSTIGLSRMKYEFWNISKYQYQINLIHLKSIDEEAYRISYDLLVSEDEHLYKQLLSSIVI